METTSRSTAAVLTLLAFGILAMLALAVLNLASNLPDMSPHAWEKHQTQAEIAYNHVQNMPNADHCKWSCNDGRDRYVCGMDDGRWAIVVVAGDTMITAFTADQEYARSIIDTPGCKNPWHYAH